MASYKESTGSRPLSQHRHASSTTPVNVPGRHGGSRNHSHSVSLGTMGNANRVTRRKSMSSHTVSSMAAMVQGMDAASLEAFVSPENKGSVIRRVDSAATARPANPASASYSTPHYAGPESGRQVKAEGEVQGFVESSEAAKIRNRRASEGSHLTKGEGKRSNADLKCDKCGKEYKHSSCLTKHLWEHTPEWAYTSKLLISKHQQVQLLEAASVLVTMNQESAIADSTKNSDSEHSSASPNGSGSSQVLEDEYSSLETTPPPLEEHGMDYRDTKRYSSTSSVFSRSYQSNPDTFIPDGGLQSSSYGSYHQSGFARRPSTSGTAYSGIGAEDDLAAAVKLCNFGTPRTVAVQDDGVPPVPPLPAQYVSHNASKSVGDTSTPFGSALSPPLTHNVSDERDSKMTDGPDEEYSRIDRRSASRGRDEHEYGFFGRMEV